MASGVQVDASAVQLFNEMKKRNVAKYATFRIEDKKVIVVDYQAPAAKTTTRDEDKVHFTELGQRLAQDEPRYIVYNFSFRMKKEARDVHKLVFLVWCPDSSSVGNKMLYAASKGYLKREFEGLSLEFQLSDMGDFDYDSIADVIEKKAWVCS